MNKDDMVLISVDDHIVEPPDMFKNHLPKKYLDEAPRLVHKSSYAAASLAALYQGGHSCIPM